MDTTSATRARLIALEGPLATAGNGDVCVQHLMDQCAPKLLLFRPRGRSVDMDACSSRGGEGGRMRVGMLPEYIAFLQVVAPLDVHAVMESSLEKEYVELD